VKLHYGLVFILSLTLLSFPLTMQTSRSSWELEHTKQLLEQQLDSSVTGLQKSIEEISRAPALVAWTQEDAPDDIQHFINLQHQNGTAAVIVTDANCKVLASTKATSLDNRFCNLGGASEFAVSWLVADQPVIVFEKRVSSQADIRVLGLVSLDREWFKGAPALAGLAKKYSIQLVENANDKKAQSLVHFRSHLPALKTEFAAAYTHWAGGFVNPDLRLKRSPELACGALALFSMLLAALTLRQGRRSKRKQAAAAKGIDRWLSEPQIKPAPESKDPLQAKLLSALHEYRVKIERLGSLATSYQKEIETLRRSEAQKVTSLHSLEQDQELSASFTQFLSVCSDAITANLHKLLTQTAQLEDVHAAHISNAPQNLFGLVKSWQVELRDKTPRKFLRTLSERILPDGSTELDQMLRKVQTYSCAVSSQTVKTSQMFGQVRKQARALTDLVGALNRTSSLKHQTAHKTLEDVVTDVTYILQRVYKLPSDKLVNFSEQNYYVDADHAFFFFCLFFQCYYTFLRQTSKTGPSSLISIKYRKKASDLVLLLQVPAYQTLLTSEETKAGLEKIRGILSLKAGELYFMNKDNKPTFMLMIPSDLRSTDSLNGQKQRAKAQGSKPLVRQGASVPKNQSIVRFGE
jgi:hypothetical protein